MTQHRIAIDDLVTAITPQLAMLQNPNDVHFTSSGYAFLSSEAATSICLTWCNASPRTRRGDAPTAVTPRSIPLC